MCKFDIIAKIYFIDIIKVVNLDEKNEIVLLVYSLNLEIIHYI